MIRFQSKSRFASHWLIWALSRNISSAHFCTRGIKSWMLFPSVTSVLPSCGISTSMTSATTPMTSRITATMLKGRAAFFINLLFSVTFGGNRCLCMKFMGTFSTKAKAPPRINGNVTPKTNSIAENTTSYCHRQTTSSAVKIISPLIFLMFSLFKSILLPQFL